MQRPLLRHAILVAVVAAVAVVAVVAVVVAVVVVVAAVIVAAVVVACIAVKSAVTHTIKVEVDFEKVAAQRSVVKETRILRANTRASAT